MPITGNDKNHLLTKQYKDSSNLDKRIDIHLRFSTNKKGWFQWFFDQLKLPDKGRILELGCGTGLMWFKNIDRLPKDCNITLSDFSAGMLEQAKNNLKNNDFFKFEVIDAQSIPFDDNSLDVVIANHMLYHVPDLDLALSEIKRVLKPDGVLYAATNGWAHLKELKEIEKKFNLERHKGFYERGNFKLENGETKLSEHFSKIKISHYKDSLAVTEIGPLIAYIKSVTEPSTDEILSKLEQYLKEEIKLNKTIHITKDSGIFIAQN